MNIKKPALYSLITIMVAFGLSGNASAQQKKQIVRMAKLVIDSTQLENYKAFLKEGIDAAIRNEPGVLLTNAVNEKNNPAHITVLEVYASDSAYEAHLQTPHFKKYKMRTKDMVKNLELVDLDPIALESKLN